jgi:hypothetical protein
LQLFIMPIADAVVVQLILLCLLLVNLILYLLSIAAAIIDLDFVLTRIGVVFPLLFNFVIGSIIFIIYSTD